MKKELDLRTSYYSASLDMKALWYSLIFSLVCILTFLLSTGIGDYYLSPVEVLQTLIGAGDPRMELIVYTFRLPRALIALMVGISLAVSGSILQSLVRNPLASPDIIGITGGASAGAVGFLAFASGASIVWQPIAAFVCGIITAFLIYLFAWKEGISPMRLILIGIGFNAAAQALTTLFLIKSPIYTASQSSMWLAGSIYSSSWKTVHLLLPWLLFFLVCTFFIVRHLNVQQLGEDIAKGLGTSLQWNQFLLVIISVALASAAVAAAGPIGFIGLMAPHIARMLVGPIVSSYLPVAACIGGILLLVADMIARTAFAPLDLPAGIFTAILGAPFVIYLLYHHGRKA
ncbi:iron chelate uptake ABC transporter family permease subunit [Mechercharimyces sp. CAU 1602]|uniref:FecCD family ABC transporter permease n=1 Tax=Mechercharimyces sp. CAU 1602 TaxID=2973933 RepID=UPI0021635F10|nr:iron ABC transporter permease [Mechercharimyces sp. CAU 1602]MCS1352836.1 iron ABC transporter permease [Mechercharimyces sp. CAU 1602]